MRDIFIDFFVEFHFVCEFNQSLHIPQIALAIGVLTVLVRRAHEVAPDALTLPGSRFPYILQYLVILTLKNT